MSVHRPLSNYSALVCRLCCVYISPMQFVRAKNIPQICSYTKASALEFPGCWVACYPGSCIYRRTGSGAWKETVQSAVGGCGLEVRFQFRPLVTGHVALGLSSVSRGETASKGCVGQGGEQRWRGRGMARFWLPRKECPCQHWHPGQAIPGCDCDVSPMISLLGSCPFQSWLL